MTNYIHNNSNLTIDADWFVPCCSYLKVAIDGMEVTDKPLLIDGNNEID